MCIACSLDYRQRAAASRRQFLRGAAAAVVGGFLAEAVDSPARAEAKDAPIVLVAANHWDGLADKSLGPVEILIRDGLIAGLGRNQGRPEGADIVDLGARTLTPGLIDCHVHVTLRPEYEAEIFNLSSSFKALLGTQNLRTLLARGFTTVRDVGDMDIHGFTTADLSRAVQMGMIEGPDLVYAGHLISTRGGHGDGSPLLGEDSHPTQLSLADGLDEIRQVVRREVSRGAHWIKFAGTGGFSSPADDPGQTPYSQEEMNAMVGAARDLGIPASPHAYGDEGIRRAIAAGCRGVEHGNLASAATLKAMEDKGIYLVPTQIAVMRQARLVDDEAFWKAANKPPYVRAKYRKYAKALMDAAQNLANSEVKIAFGTDVGTFTWDTNNAGEFKEMTANGIAAPRALRAGTSMAAEMLGLTDRGVLQVGKRADIVAVPGDPFGDVTVMERVDFVMKQGTVRHHAGGIQ